MATIAPIKPFNPHWASIRSCQAGISLIEVAISIGILAIVAGFSLVQMNALNEEPDGSMAQSVQSSLQVTLIQGADRLNTSPRNVTMTQVAAASPITDPGFTLTVGSPTQATLTMTRSARAVTFRKNDCGQVCVDTLAGFTRYALRPQPNSCDTDATVCNAIQHI